MMMMAMLLTLLAALCPSISGGGQPPMCVAVVVNVCFTAAAAAAAAAASTACVSVSNVDQLYVLSVHLGVRSVAEIWTGIEQPPASDKPSTPLARSLRATYAAAGPRHQGSVSLLVGTPIDDAVLHLVRCVSVCLSVCLKRLVDVPCRRQRHYTSHCTWHCSHRSIDMFATRPSLMDFVLSLPSISAVSAARIRQNIIFPVARNSQVLARFVVAL